MTDGSVAASTVPEYSIGRGRRRGVAIFPEHTGFGPAAVDSVWPDTVMEKHRDTWIAFRA